ncbi:signal peptidase I [Streptomyces sp. H39-S7]|uniref:signal peptidase I n=1 Tax=Streptomyces sp. H39-S7 TaxID=3004357 RepID=UPI003FA71273
MDNPVGSPRPVPAPVRRTNRRRLVVWCAVAVAGALLMLADIVAFWSNTELFSQSSDAMRPTFTQDSTIVAEKVDGSEVGRGDVVVIPLPEWGIPARVLKRVIGIGGDRVTCTGQGPVVVNGKPLDEPYLLNGMVNWPERSCDASGRPPAFTITGGHTNDCTQRIAVMEAIRVPRIGPGRPRVRQPAGWACPCGSSKKATVPFTLTM